jgi:hypothetical protein
VTAAQNDLIFDAARRRQEPRVDFCRWHDGLIEFPTIEPDFRPDPQHPLSIICSGVCISPSRSC